MYGCTNCTLEIICIHTKTIFCNILITTQMDQLLSHRKKNSVLWEIVQYILISSTS